MDKGETGSTGLLSKLARFVRHPTVDWNELDQRARGVDAEREALKAAILRKRRNDKVRHNELNQLRAVMQARQQAVPSAGSSGSGASAAGVSVLPSSFHAPSPADGDKNRTIEQIARIEQQMSQNWLRRRQEDKASGLRIGSGTDIPAQMDGGLTRPAHLGARTLAPEEPISIDVVASDPNATGADLMAALAHPALGEAAVFFANGDMVRAEEGLRALMVQEVRSLTARVAGLALLDLFHARRDFEAFEEFAAEFAERFGVPVPRWPAALQAVPAPTPDSGHAASGSAGIWVSPLFLDAAAVEALERIVAAPGAVKWLDWSGLLSADLPAAQALQRALHGWLERPIELRFQGAAVLRRRLKASTPSGRRENDPVWWLLRLSMLRLMRRRDEFDLAALDYCVTYAVAPPEWREPLCRFLAVDSMPASMADGMAPMAEPIQPLSTQLGGLDVHEWPALETTVAGSETQFPSAPTQISSEWPTTLPVVTGATAQLSGTLLGEMPQAIAALDAALATHPAKQVFAIDCQGLDRLDFAAAGTLMQWLLAATARGVQVELRGISRLLAAFFHVVGIDEAVTLRLRQY